MKEKKEPINSKMKGSPGNKAEFLISFVKNNGNRQKALDHVGLQRSSFYKWIDKDPEFKQAFEDAKEALVDRAEETVHKSIKEGDVESAKFLLERLGKDRGWQKTLNVKAEISVHAADIIKQVHERRNNTQTKDDSFEH